MPSRNTVVCTEYENLLFSCKDALDDFRIRREELRQYGQNNHEAMMSLVRLRAGYQTAYSKLIHHFDSCALCQRRPGDNAQEKPGAVIPFKRHTG
jgi:hypothetical protein